MMMPHAGLMRVPSETLSNPSCFGRGSCQQQVDLNVCATDLCSSGDRLQSNPSMGRLRLATLVALALLAAASVSFSRGRTFELVDAAGAPVDLAYVAYPTWNATEPGPPRELPGKGARAGAERRRRPRDDCHRVSCPPPFPARDASVLCGWSSSMCRGCVTPLAS